MKKVLMLAPVAALLLSSAALAQPDSCLWFDIRDNTSTNQVVDTGTFPYTVGGANAGKAGDGQTLYITPHYSDNYETTTNQAPGWPNNDADNDTHTGALWMYMDVYQDDVAGTNPVISSIGVDLAVSPPGAPKNTISSLSFGWDAAWFANPGNTGKNAGTSTPTGVVGAKVVHVPVNSTPAFDTTGGCIPVNPAPNYTRYRVGRLNVAGGPRNCTFASGFEATSTYTLKMTTNNLLITRTFNTGGDAQERVAFGYSGGAPASPYVNGWESGKPTGGATVGTIIVNMKGDFSNDGRITTLDNSQYVAARNAGIAGATQRQIFHGDFTGDRKITTLDNSKFVAARNHSPTCP